MQYGRNGKGSGNGDCSGNNDVNSKERGNGGSEVNSNSDYGGTFKTPVTVTITCAFFARAHIRQTTACTGS